MGSKSVAESGIAEFVDNSTEVNFKQSIDDSKTLRTLFNYNSRFLLDYERQVDGLLSRGGTAEFIFLNPQSSTINHMKQLGWEPKSMDSHFAKIDRVTNEWKRKHGNKVRVFFR